MPRSIDIGSPAEEKHQSKLKSCLTWLDRYSLFELLCVALSAAALVTIVAALQIFDGKQQPQWRISLNTTVSFLTIFAKFGVVGLLGNGLGQLKWIWFSDQSRNLKDVETFDYASRGEVWANCRLPIKQRFRYAMPGAV